MGLGIEVTEPRVPVQKRPPTENENALVYVVDDDDQAREYVTWLLESAGWPVQAYDNAEGFLANYSPALPGCLVSDVRMPGLNGLDLQRELTARSIELPIIMISAFAEVSMAVRAMRDGALDFLEKPFDGQTLLERVRSAVEADRQRRRDDAERKAIAASFAKLSPRQRAVLEGLTAGKPSKVIAAELGVSPRTVDVHRFRLMRQLGAESLPDLFRRVVLVRGGRPT
jgi:two-component system response regulator FixJ